MIGREAKLQNLPREIDGELAGFNAGLKTLEEKRKDVLEQLRREVEQAALAKVRKILEQPHEPSGS